MKRFLFLFIACLSVAGFFSACINNNDNDRGYYDVGTINKTDDASANYTITLDDSTLLLPTTTDSYGPTLKNGERVYVKYGLVSANPSSVASSVQYNVKILGISPILTKPIFNITPATQDSIGNDPIIRIDNMWISGKYLNFMLDYYGGTTVHYLNLVKDSQKQQDPTGATVNLELRHNSKGDAGQTGIGAIVCFDLTSLQKAGRNSLNIVISDKEYYGQTTTKQITYTYTGTKSAISKQQNKINISTISTSNILK